MTMILLADLGEVLGSSAVALHVFDTGSPEHPGRSRERELEELGFGLDVPPEWLFTVLIADR